MKLDEILASPERLSNLQQMLDVALKEYSSDRCPLYGNIFAYYGSDIPGSDLNKLYVLIGKDPACAGPEWPRGLDPVERIRRQAENPQLHFTDMYLRDMTGLGDELHVNGEFVNWMSTEEMLCRLYAKYGAPIPPTIHLQELEYLTEVDALIRELRTPDGARAELEKKLQKFFAVERSHGLRYKWRQFVRSDKCPATKGRLARFFAFLRRKSNIVSMEQLWVSTDNMKEMVMAERDYRRLADTIRKKYPEITYAISKKVVRNEGLDKRTGPTVQEGVRRITDDEFEAIKRERFAKEGWDCLADLRPSKFELRSIYYKEADAEVIASIYQSIIYEFAKPESMREIRSWGDCDIISVAEVDFDNFVSMAKCNHIPFALDTQGAVRAPVMGKVHVLYPSYYAPLVLGCLESIINDTISNAHTEQWRNEVSMSSEVELQRRVEKKPKAIPANRSEQISLDAQIQKAQKTADAQNVSVSKTQLPDKKRIITIDDIQL